MQQEQKLQHGMEECGLGGAYPFQTRALFNRISLQPGAAYKLVDGRKNLYFLSSYHMQ